MLILASRSPARQTLMRQAGLVFDVETGAIDEREIETQILKDGGDAGDVALGLAAAKAHAVSGQHPEAVVIGADQTLALGNEVLHKPADREAARAQLDRLRGRTHALHSAVALAQAGEIVWSKLETARLTMRSFTDEERERILDQEGDSILGSVGAYRLEGPSVQFFEAIDGDYFAILGLPLMDLLAALRQHAPDALAAPR